METVHVAGVPEHFNYAWHVAMERGLFHAHDVHVVWQDVGAGTGAMVRPCPTPTDPALALSA